MKEYINEDGTPFSKEQFIERIKTDEKFSKRFGNLGPIYGKQWRSWSKVNIETKPYIHNGETHFTFDIDNQPIDQIANLISELKTNPDSRRLMVSAWNVGELDQMTLPPCHYGFQVYTRELSLEERENLMDKIYGLTKETRIVPWNILDINKANIPTRSISLMWSQRSVDSFLGLPFNIASYGLLLEIIAKAVNMVPDELIGTLGDVHLYSNHIEQAKEQIGRELVIEERVKWAYDRKLIDYVTMVETEELDKLSVPTRTREPYPLPTLKINSGNENWDLLTVNEIINSLDVDITFKPENYRSHSSIKAPLSN